MKENTKAVLITGASGGLGRATAELFLRRGFHVVGADVRAEEPNEYLRPNYIPLTLDVTNPASIGSALDELRRKNIRISILVNIAGVFEVFPLVEDPADRLQKVMDVNTFGPARLVNAFLGDLIMNKGRVIMISSESWKFPGLFQPYQVSKIALEAYSRTIRQELALKGVSLVIIRPGAIRTSMVDSVYKMENPIGMSRFQSEFENFCTEAVRNINRVVSPDKVALLIHHACTVKRPRYIYRINHNPRLSLFSLFPDRLIDTVVKRLVAKGS